MKNLTVLTLSLFASLSSAFADNTVKTVSQVAEAVTLSDDVDYHITSDTPFTTSGSVNITNTDHAVLVLDKLKPSLALKQLGFVTINGEAAKNGVNCQVKIYNLCCRHKAADCLFRARFQGRISKQLRTREYWRIYEHPYRRKTQQPHPEL